MPLPTESGRPRFAVIVPSFNEAANIGRCLDAVKRAAARHEPVEIIVVDNGSADATAEIAAREGARVIVPERRLRISALRNLGAARSSGRILAFLDADMEPPVDWLDRVDARFREGRVGVLGFIETTPPGAPWFARLWAEQVLARRDRAMEVDYLPGRNLCVAREAFEKVGGFDEALATSEDKDLVMRLHRTGAVAISDPALAAGFLHWGCERSLAEWIRKEFWRQGSHIAMIRRHGMRARLVRFPLAGVGHALWPLAPAAAAAAGRPGAAAGLLLLWWMPALAVSLGHRLSRSTPVRAVQFTFLHWLRFCVAGWSVLRELVLGLQPRG